MDGFGDGWSENGTSLQQVDLKWDADRGAKKLKKLNLCLLTNPVLSHLVSHFLP